MNQSFIPKFVAELKAQQQELALAAMTQPRSELVHYGVMAGRHQGIQLALDTLDSIMRDELNQEKHS